MNTLREMKRKRRLKGLDETGPPNPRDAQWRRAASLAGLEA